MICQHSFCELKANDQGCALTSNHRTTEITKTLCSQRVSPSATGSRCSNQKQMSQCSFVPFYSMSKWRAVSDIETHQIASNRAT